MQTTTFYVYDVSTSTLMFTTCLHLRLCLRRVYIYTYVYDVSTSTLMFTTCLHLHLCLRRVYIYTYVYDVSTSTLSEISPCPYMLLFSPIAPLGQNKRGNNRKVIIGSDTVTALRNKPLLDCCFFSISAPKKAITNIASK